MDIAHILTILLLEVALPTELQALLTFDGSTIAKITRLNIGDTFQATGVDCNSDTCIGLSSGTAATVPQQPQQSNRKTCLCQCHSHLPAFREDLQICVDDIRECVVAPFVSGSTAQQIPFVFLPLRGQIIHPSKEISFAGVATPICAVSGAKFLTESGWVDLRNPLETDVPFRLYRDEGRTFLQWEGESILRNRMSGRMVLVHLKCKDLDTDTDSGQELEAEFSPCVAFRVVGTPLKYPNKFAKMLFPPDAQSSDASNKIEQNVSENLIFAIASIILGLIYGVVAFLYLNLRKKRQLGDVKLGVQVVPNLSRLERGIVKDNPLVKLEECYLAPISFRNDSELKNDGSQGEGDDHDDELHRYANDIYEQINPPNYPTITFEKLPEEGVSIVETLDVNENHIKNVPTLLPSKTKLYFNLHYFDGDLLQNPPPQAIEFLIKMRGVIRAAKERMLANKFSPNLLDIPEEYPSDMKCQKSQLDHPDFKDSMEIDYLGVWENLAKLAKSSRRTRRMPVIKPKCPPPPVPVKLEHSYDEVSEICVAKTMNSSQTPSLRRALPMKEELTVVNSTILLEAKNEDNSTLLQWLQCGNLLNEVYINSDYSSSSTDSNSTAIATQPSKQDGKDTIQVKNSDLVEDNLKNIDTNFNRRFGSLREIYLAKIKQRSLLPCDLHQPVSPPVYDEPKSSKIVSESKPPLPPKKSKQKLQNRSSDYEPVGQNFDQTVLAESNHDVNNQFILQTKPMAPIPNLTRTVFKQSFDKNAKFINLLGKYLQKPEDSDYISTDSEDFYRNSYYKRQILQRRHSVGISSETDDSVGDERSDSDIESIEAGSFLFESLMKYRIANPIGSEASTSNTSSDSDRASYVTVTNRGDYEW